MSDQFVPFVDGWDQKNCPVEVSANDYYATLSVKGENLTTDWLSKAVKGAYHNGGNEIESTISNITDYENGTFSVDINFASVYGEGDTAKFEIDGVQSAWMNIVKAN